MSKVLTESLKQILEDNPELKALHDQRGAFEEVLPRLAVPRSFTETLYQHAIREGSSLTFEDLIQRPEVRSVPERPGCYWLASSSLDAGRAIDDPLRPQHAQAMLKVLDQSSATALLDRLTVLAFADPRQAGAEWTAAFNHASDANDLAACYTLAQAIEGLVPYLPDQSLCGTLRELRARYFARALFLREWHRTATYYPRHSARREFDRLLNSKADGKWIFQLFAAGGMGKTMFLESQIARHLVCGADRTLVARLDLDFLAVNNLVNIPWLMAIEIGRQLDLQLPLPAFSDYLSRLQSFAPLLYSPQSDRYQSLHPEHAAGLFRQAREQRGNWGRFLSIVASLPQTTKVVFILDTVEEASLYFPKELRVLLENLTKLHKVAPQFRLVLSGRYHLGEEHLPQLYDKELKDATRESALRAFTFEEASAFLRKCLPDLSQEMQQAVLNTARYTPGPSPPPGDVPGYFPFKLALLIEVLIDEPTTRLEDLTRYEDADVAYLIQRVVKRIPSPGLRWLVRYGAVPRRLTKNFVREVMVPHLERALSGEAKSSGADDPEQDVWLPDATAERDPDRLWAELGQYSSQRGWINIDPADPDLASFHPDIVNPTRRLLSRQKIFQTLHQEAAAYASRQATLNPDRAADYRLAEFYHSCQLPNAQPGRQVVQLLNSIADPADRFRIASELIAHRDFAEVPQRWPRLIAAESYIATEDWRYCQKGSAWSFIRTHLLAAQQADPEPLPMFYQAWLATESEPHSTLAGRLKEYLRRWDLSPDDRLRAILLLDELLTDPEESRTSLELAIDIAKRQKVLFPVAVLEERLGILLRDKGQLDQAQPHLEAALQGARTERNQQRLLRLVVDGAIAMFRPEQMQHLLQERLSSATGDAATFLRRQYARLHLEVENPLGALAHLSETDQDPETLLIRANAFAQLLRVFEALELYSRVEQSAPTPELREAAIVGRARLMVKEVGLDSRESLRDLAGDGPAIQLLRDWGLNRPVLFGLLVRARTLEPGSACLKLFEWPALEDQIGPWTGRIPEAHPSGPAEACAYALRTAELYVALGRCDDARRTLQSIVAPRRTTRPNTWPLMAFRRRRQLEDRIAQQDPAFQVEIDSPAIYEPFQESAQLHQACLMELAQRAMLVQRYEVVRECLHLARDVESSQTRYGAIYRALKNSIDEATPVSAGATQPPGLPFTVLSRQGGRLGRWTAETGRQLLSVLEDPALESAVQIRLHGDFLRQLATQPGEVQQQFDQLIQTNWIVATDPVLLCIPWELSTASPCRFIPRNPALRSAIRRFDFEPADLSQAWDSHCDPAPRPPVGLVLVMPRRDQMTPAYSAYQDAVRRFNSIIPTQIVNPWMEDEGLPLPPDGVNLLHLALGIEEIQHVPTLAGLNMQPASLARRLLQSGGVVRPIVILDPPRPYSDSERLECILARNRFAHQLAESGAVEGVIATGLGADEEQRKLHSLLLEAFQARAPLEETCRTIQHAGDDLTFRATALFACNPSVSLP